MIVEWAKSGKQAVVIVLLAIDCDTGRMGAIEAREWMEDSIPCVRSALPESLSIGT